MTREELEEAEIYWERKNNGVNSLLGEEAVIKESLFFKDCGNNRCVYNMKGNCRCRNIGNECQSYIK